MSEKDDTPYDLDAYRRQEEREILFRLDERTERMDQRIGRVDDRMGGVEESLAETDRRLDKHGKQIHRNTTILNAITFGLGTTLTAVFAKLQGIIKL